MREGSPSRPSRLDRRLEIIQRRGQVIGELEHELGSAKHHLDHLGREIAASGLPAA